MRIFWGGKLPPSWNETINKFNIDFPSQQWTQTCLNRLWLSAPVHVCMLCEETGKTHFDRMARVCWWRSWQVRLKGSRSGGLSPCLPDEDRIWRLATLVICFWEKKLHRGKVFQVKYSSNDICKAINFNELWSSHSTLNSANQEPTKLPLDLWDIHRKATFRY